MLKFLNYFLIVIVLLFFPKCCFSKSEISVEYTETQEIFKSHTLTKEQKLQKLERFFDKYPGMTAYLLIELDKNAARQIILKHFSNPKISKAQKLEFGSILLQKLDAREIIPEFKDFLVKDILDNINEFMRPQEDYAASGLAEYVYIASQFNGYKDPQLFDAFRDERTVPNLIKALDAPDWVYPKDQGDCIRGISGQSTGRNVARQLIPIALAKLNAKSAIPALKSKFQKHHDGYLQMNSAYALGYLLGDDEKKDFVNQLPQQKGAPFYAYFSFEFTKGSIAAGDYPALKYIHLDSNPRGKEWSSILYDIEQKLGVLIGVKDPNAKDFYSELIAYEPFRQLVTADFAKISIGEKEWQMGFKSKEDYLNQQMHRIVKIYDQLVQGVELNGFTDLWADVKALGENSSSLDIRNIAK